MPLDPQAKIVLEQIAALGLPELQTLSPQAAREQFALTRLPVAGPELLSVEDRSVPGPNGDVPIRIYTPAGDAPLPVVVYFHGGGWVIGSIETHDVNCRYIADGADCVVVSVDYRLAPEHKFPEPVEDAYAATQWVARNAESIAADASRIAVVGDSAGGNLAAAICLMARDRGGPAIAQQTLVYPAMDYNFDTPSYRDNAAGYLLTLDAMRWFWRHYLRNEADGADPYASPLRAHDLRGLPPALIITTEFDPLRDEGEAYAARLKAAGVPVTCTRYDGTVHGFFGMIAVLDRAKEAISEVCGALRTAFEPVPA